MIKALLSIDRSLAAVISAWRPMFVPSAFRLSQQEIIMEQKKHLIDWSDFSKIDIRVGTIRSAEIFKEAKKPAYKIVVDFGDYGTRKTSAQITKLYSPAEIIGRQVVAVVNFAPKQIANIQSECLILGAVNHHEVVLLAPAKPVINGLRIG